MSTTNTYKVEGMTCAHCVAAVTEELSKLAGVSHVDVELASGRATIRSNHPLDTADVAAAVDEAGYTLTA